MALSRLFLWRAKFDVARLDEEDEGGVAAGGEDGQGGPGHVGQGGVLVEVGRGVRLGLAVEVGRGVEPAVGGAEGEVVEVPGAEEAEESPARAAARSAASRRTMPPRLPGVVRATTYLPPFSTSIAPRSASVR